jgi:hypothetical protein
LKLNGTHQFLVYTDINILGGSIQKKKKNTETLVAASKGLGVEVNLDKTKQMFMSQDENTGQSHNTKNDNTVQQILT